MTQRTGRSVGGAALLAGVVMAVAMFIVQLIGVLAAARR